MRIPKLPKLGKIPSRSRLRVIEAAQRGLTEYLSSTRSVPLLVAEHISKNSLVSLSTLISQVPFTSTSDFSTSLGKFLLYHPVNELEFFYESLGLEFDEVRLMLPSTRFFLCEDSGALDVACVLFDFGFPWNRLGTLYKEERSVFGRSKGEVGARLGRIKGYGFGNLQVIGICLTFPGVLSGDDPGGGQVGGLLDDLKRVFLDFGLEGSVEANVDAWCEVCRKIQVFYDLGCEKGKVGELMCVSKHAFVDYSLEVLVQKTEYFCRFGVSKGEVGWLILQRPEMLDFDLETQMISVEGLLRHFGISDEQLESVAQRYPHTLGRNRIANLPNVMRAMDLSTWFIDNLKNGNHHLLATYVFSDSDEHLDTEFTDSLEMIRASKTSAHTMSKLDFMHEIGFGQNAHTIKVLRDLHGTSSKLRERFNCLFRAGVEFSKLFLMICAAPKILNQQPETIERKLDFLCSEMGLSFRELDAFPALLCFNLENRIKPRYRFHKWLAEKGLPASNYSIASIVATSEKNFIHRAYGFHPAAPKHYFERFSCTKSATEQKN